MKNKENVTNWPQFFHKNKFFLAFFAFCFLGAIAAIVYFLNMKAKIGQFELSKSSLGTDSVKEDTVFFKKDISVADKKEIVNPKTKIGPASVSDVEGESVNINTGTNNGIIGNGNNIFIASNAVQRKLNDLQKNELLILVEKEQKKIRRFDSLASCINVMFSTGDRESFHFANEIKDFLSNQNMNVSKHLGSFLVSPPVVGVDVIGKNGCVDVRVGSNI